MKRQSVMDEHRKMELDDSDFDSLDLQELVLKIISGWRVLVLSVMLFSILAVVFLNVSEKQYEAKMIVTSTKGEGGTGGLGKYSSLANMAGINLSEGGEGGFNKYENFLTSPDQMQALIKENPHILRVLFGGEWSSQSKGWKEPGGVVSFVKKVVVRPFLNGSKWQPPSAERLAMHLQEKLILSKDMDTGFLTIIYEHPDAEFGAWLVGALHKSADNLLRSRERVRTDQRLDYLSETLAGTGNRAQREVLIELLSDEQQKMMMIEADESYVAEIVQFPVVSKIPTQPKPILTMLMAGLLGLVFGCFVVMVAPLNLSSFRLLVPGKAKIT